MQACQLGLSRPIAICNFLNLLTLVKKLAAGLFKDDRLTVFEFFFPKFICLPPWRLPLYLYPGQWREEKGGKVYAAYE